MNYYHILKKKSEELGEKVFLQVDVETYSYARLQSDAAAIAQQLKLPRQTVLIDAAGLYEQLVLFLAVQGAGSVPILMHHDLPPQAAAELREVNQIRCLLTAGGALPKGADSIWQIGWAHLCCFPGELQILPAEASACVGVLSSGSSGAPKVMLRSYESWAGFFPVQNAIFKVSGSSRLFLQGSLSFTGNLNALLAVLYAGGSVVTSCFFRCRTWIRLLRQFSVDVVYLVPAKLKLLLEFMAEPLPAVRMLFTGSQLLGSVTARQLRQMLPQSEILLYYGASELNYITYITYEEMLQNPLSVGRPFPGVRLSFADGYVYVDTAYHIYGAKMPFTVKDAGYLSPDGQLIFLGRKQAVINRGGFKVSCLKVELAIRQLAGVDDAVVLPYADEKRGSEIAAFIVAAAAEQWKILRAIRQKLMPAEQPRRFVFLPAIPLNDRGKVDTACLQAQL